MDESMLEELKLMSTSDILTRVRMIESELKILSSENSRLKYELQDIASKTKEFKDRAKVYQQLPYLVSTVVEILKMPLEEDDKNDPEALARGYRMSCVIKTSTRHSYFLPKIGLIDESLIKPNSVVGVNKDTNLIIEMLPEEYDQRVKCMEIDEKPKEDYSNIGGLEKQINELLETVVYPMTKKEKFEKLGIKPPKGVLLYGPPGTGKTLLARACAAQTKATFLKLGAPQLVQMFIGDGAKMVRDAFALAKAKKPTIIFIDELDAIGMKRFNSDKAGDREVQRTMLELLNQLDGFTPSDDIKVIAATNRVDTLDPALLRSGRFDNKIEFPVPNEDSRVKIFEIHTRSMNLNKNVSFRELAKSTDGFNGAQVKGVCVEAGMAALRNKHDHIIHEDFVEGVMEIQSRKKANHSYYA